MRSYDYIMVHRAGEGCRVSKNDRPGGVNLGPGRDYY